jgi:hypothetical protein
MAILKNIIRLGLALACLIAPAAAGTFDGNLQFTPPGCEQAKKCRLVNDFGFTDSNGTGWLAKSGPDGLETDGASIPPWAQPFIGGQFDAAYIKAAVIHDHYCWRHVRTWESTHDVFYDALISAGVSKPKALLMYYAVYRFGPKWTELIPGKSCGLGGNCTFKLVAPIWPTDTKFIERTEDGKKRTFRVRAAKYDDPKLATSLKQMEALISIGGEKLSRADIRRVAEQDQPNDFFFGNSNKLFLLPQQPNNQGKVYHLLGIPQLQ